MSGPGQKYLVSPLVQTLAAIPGESQFPDIHGTGELYLTPRDPHCLYAHWDITAAQQSRYNALSAHHHLLVRMRADGVSGPLVSEMHVHPESRHWFIHVPDSGTTYVAELGYQTPEGRWQTIALSAPVATPHDAVSEDRSVQFITVSPDIPLARASGGMPEPPRESVPEQGGAAGPLVVAEPGRSDRSLEPVAEQGMATSPLAAAHDTGESPHAPALAPGRGECPHEPALTTLIPAPGRTPGAFGTAKMPPPAWSLLQEQLLEEIISETFVRHETIGSIELAEIVREQARRPRRQPPAVEVASIAAAQLELPTSPGAEVISSPGAPPEEALPQPGPGKSFWFKVNAELVIYGSTEPDATVTIGNRRIRLRPDGTFSYRFALPDGHYQLPIKAVASHGDQRRADLEFYRGTEYSGEVGAHPQDPSLKVPAPENVS